MIMIVKYNIRSSNKGQNKILILVNNYNNKYKIKINNKQEQCKHKTIIKKSKKILKIKN